MSPWLVCDARLQSSTADFVPVLPRERCRTVRIVHPEGSAIRGRVEYRLGSAEQIQVAFDFELARDGLHWVLGRLALVGDP